MLYLAYSKHRYLSWMLYSGVHFSHLESDSIGFSSIEEVEEFREKWKGSSFALERLGIVESICQHKKQGSDIMFLLEYCKGRYLINISYTCIAFNIGEASAMKFETLDEINDFKEKWKNHYFDLNQLSIVKDGRLYE